MAQAPRPLQLAGSVRVCPVQVCWMQAVVAGGYVHPPVASQSVAPQPYGSLVVQAAVQQWPLPAVPQVPVVQASLLEQAVPAATWGWHEPLEQWKLATQSLVRTQEARQAVVLAQVRWPGQVDGVPARQAPWLQLLVVR
jgi:hypothetical protein